MRRRHVGALGGVAVLVGTACWGLAALADTYSDPDGVPRLVPFRGHLSDSGSAVAEPVSLAFAIFDRPADPSLRLWPAAGTETHVVTPSNGAFNVMLGQSVPLPASVFAAGDAYVQVSVNGTVLAPRQRLGAVPYALRSVEAVSSLSAAGPLRAELDTVGSDLDTVDSDLATLRTDLSSRATGYGLRIGCPPSSPPTITQQIPGAWASVATISGGRYEVSFNAGVFSSPPMCNAEAGDNSGFTHCVAYTASTASVRVDCFNIRNEGFDARCFSILCVGN